MSRRLVSLLAALAALVPVATATANGRPHAATAGGRGHATSGPAAGGLPADGPAALYRREPRLPAADGWPGGGTAFPRTSGTGRYAGGGFFWTDYLYDDHGTTAASPGDPSVTAGSPSFGTYTYPDGPAHGNGADIFRAAVMLRGRMTYWRVDWNTLADPRVPIAEWTFDRDDRASTGTAAWPAGAGVTSPGIDTALLVSSRGARLVRATDGVVTAHLPVTVDRAAHSFVVAVPSSLLRPAGTWRVRLAAGLADAAGTGFARPPQTAPTQPAVYNVTFRTPEQEVPADDYWNDLAQTRALAQGDVTPFSVTLSWTALAHRRTTPEPMPRGWSDRWYVSAVDLGPGIVTDPSSISDDRPNYLGRVQPYAVYVPHSYDARRPAPLTFLLHSLTQNHNQYAATTPQFTQLACERRHSICVTTLGRGPDGGYHDDAELDFWQVWHAVAAAYRLDPDRTVLCGYSMGGIGSNQLAMEHPDLFARSVTLAGGVGDVPALTNLRWVPTYLAGGAEDELVRVTTQKAEADGLDALGYRYRWVVFPVMDHVAYELADSFADAAAYMGDARRAVDPGRITFTWTPRDTAGSDASQLSQGGIAWTQRADLGVGTTGAYWLRHLKARTLARDASVDARSGLRPDLREHLHRSRTVEATMSPEPAVVTTLGWTAAGRPRPRAVLRLRLTNVASLSVLLAAAGFGPGRSGLLVVDTDGPTTVDLGGRRVRLAAGHHAVRFRA